MMSEELKEDAIIARKEYLQAMRDTLEHLANEDLPSENKFNLIKAVCDGLLNDIETLHTRYDNLYDWVDDIQETLTVVAKNR